MTRYGYFLSSEEYEPASLIEQARMAERAGFEALWISDHFHPWLDAQGQSSFVWSFIGAISQVSSLPITTAVTCPTPRIHPAVIAQAAATAGLLTGGRFNLGVGTGEALNEHVTGARWPAAEERQEMLEAVGARSRTGPLHQQQRGVIAQVAGLVIKHRLDQAPKQFIGCPAAGGFPFQQIGQPVETEQFPVRGPCLGHPVGVQQHRVLRLKLLNAWLGGRIAEPERQHCGTAELGDHLAAAQQQRPRMPGTRPLQPP